MVNFKSKIGRGGQVEKMAVKFAKRIERVSDIEPMLTVSEKTKTIPYNIHSVDFRLFPKAHESDIAPSALFRSDENTGYYVGIKIRLPPTPSEEVDKRGHVWPKGKVAPDKEWVETYADRMSDPRYEQYHILIQGDIDKRTDRGIKVAKMVSERYPRSGLPQPDTFTS